MLSISFVLPDNVGLSQSMISLGERLSKVGHDVEFHVQTTKVSNEYDLVFLPYSSYNMSHVPLVATADKHSVMGRVILCLNEQVAENVITTSPVLVMHPIVEDKYFGGTPATADKIGFPADRESTHRGSLVVSELESRMPEFTFIRAEDLPHEEMKNFYAQCRLLIIPSSLGTCGRAIVEASSAGVPVITTDVAGTRESLCAAEILDVSSRVDVQVWEDTIRRRMTEDYAVAAWDARYRYLQYAQRQETEIAQFLALLPSDNKVGSTLLVRDGGEARARKKKTRDIRRNRHQRTSADGDARRIVRERAYALPSQSAEARRTRSSGSRDFWKDDRNMGH